MKSANKTQALEAMAKGWRYWHGWHGPYLTGPKGEKRDVNLASGKSLLRSRAIEPIPKEDWHGQGQEYRLIRTAPLTQTPTG